MARRLARAYLPLVDPDTAARLRAEMVERQLRGRGIRDEAVLAAMAAVPRELFVPPDLLNHAYSDDALPIEVGQAISQPYMVAQMTELLAPRPGMRVLEVGTGSGYQAAVLATIGCRVVSIERHTELAETAIARLAQLNLLDRVRVEVGDGSLGRPEDAPFEGIVVTAAAPAVPSRLREQLHEGGRLVVPVGSVDRQELVLVIRHGSDFEERPCGSCVFVPLVGAGGFDERTSRRRPWFGRLRL
ncbi:MAG: protein-L-isoaspartate(D-aspartate) O-methyltransferase [Candidatus Limnocylindrales bacterium]